MKIYLHIGTEKTGTTSIQQFLFQHREELLRHKILYPKSLGVPNNVKLPIAIENCGKISSLRKNANIIHKKDILSFRTFLQKELENECQEFSPDILIVSNEHLSSRLHTIEELLRLKNFFKTLSDDIEVILYIRRQDKFFESLYSTAIKSGHVSEFEYPERGKERKDFYYNTMISLWEKVFEKENINLRIFEKSELYKNDVVHDFVHLLNLPIEKCAEKSQRANTSFGMKKLSFLKMFNKYNPKFYNNRLNRMRGNIEKILEEIEIEDQPIQMNSAEKFSFLQRFESENEKIRERYFPDRKELFDHIKDDTTEKISPSISTEDSVQISSELWKAQVKRLQNQSRTMLFLKSENLFLREEYTEALSQVNLLLERFPNFAQAHFLKSNIHLAEKNIQEAIISCQKAIESDPKCSLYQDKLSELKAQ